MNRQTDGRNDDDIARADTLPGGDQDMTLFFNPATGEARAYWLMAPPPAPPLPSLASEPARQPERAVDDDATEVNVRTWVPGDEGTAPPTGSTRQGEVYRRGQWQAPRAREAKYAPPPERRPTPREPPLKYALPPAHRSTPREQVAPAPGPAQVKPSLIPVVVVTTLLCMMSAALTTVAVNLVMRRPTVSAERVGVIVSSTKGLSAPLLD